MGKIWVLLVMVTSDAEFLWKLNIEGIVQFPLLLILTTFTF
jgi:hypothetical protein